MPIRGGVQACFGPPPVTIRAMPRASAGRRNDNHPWGAMLADRDSLLRRLHELRSEHRDLDTVITRLNESGADALQLQRLKKRKLKLKDEIAWLESRLVPDIIA
jgi:hypothetical protein